MLTKRYKLFTVYHLSNVYLLKFRSKALLLELLGKGRNTPPTPQSLFKKNKSFEWGIYEYDYAGDYIKLIRNHVFHNMFAKVVPQKLSISFEYSELLPLYDVVIEHCIELCQLSLDNKKITSNKVMYTISI